MADRHPSAAAAENHAADFLRKIQAHSPNSNQVIGFFTLLTAGGILLLLTGVTVTVVVLGLIIFTPLLVVSSPVWLPIATVLFIAVAGFLSTCGFGVAVVAGLSWIYKYFKGRHPPGADRVDYARSRIADRASHVKDYAREYSGAE